jgi:3-isopropylmalate/(R)-2-methylmalate dehydratase small subunit
MKQPFTVLTGIAAPMLRDNIDTDAIIPSRESTSVARDGYGEKLFANWRYRPGTRIEQPDFVLNRPPYRRATMLIGGYNFGCGSSREAAVWSLVQFGIRCVIAKSFGEIFRKNSVCNGLLPVLLPADGVDALAGQAGMVRVDLQTQTVTAPSGEMWSFGIDALDRAMLLEGLDAIELTLKQSPAIAAFQARDRQTRPWIYARSESTGHA